MYVGILLLLLLLLYLSSDKEEGKTDNAEGK
jgi:hypothetical protein